MSLACTVDRLKIAISRGFQPGEWERDEAASAFQRRPSAFSFPDAPQEVPPGARGTREGLVFM